MKILLMWLLCTEGERWILPNGQWKPFNCSIHQVLAFFFVWICTFLIWIRICLCLNLYLSLSECVFVYLTWHHHSLAEKPRQVAADDICSHVWPSLLKHLQQPGATWLPVASSVACRALSDTRWSWKFARIEEVSRILQLVKKPGNAAPPTFSTPKHQGWCELSDFSL